MKKGDNQKLLIVGFATFILSLIFLLLFPIRFHYLNSSQVSALLHYTDPSLWILLFFWGILFIIALRNPDSRNGLIILLVIVFLTYSIPYYGQRILRDHDSWLHLNTCKEILENGHLTITKDLYTTFPGFFILIIVLEKISALNMPLLEKMITPFFALILFSTYYLAFRRWTKNDRWTIFCMLSLFISDIGYLAGDHMSPALLTNIIYPLILFCFTSRDKKYAFLSLLFTASVVITHPTTAVYLPLIFAILYTFKKNFWSSLLSHIGFARKIGESKLSYVLSGVSIDKIFISATMFFAWSIFYSFTLTHNVILDINSVIGNIMQFGRKTTIPHFFSIQTPPLLFFFRTVFTGYVLLVLALIGFLYLIKSRKQFTFIGIWLGLMISSYLFGSAIIEGLPYSRSLDIWLNVIGLRLKNFAIFPLCLLSGYSFFSIFNILYSKKLVKKNQIKFVVKRYLKPVLYIFIVCAIIVTPLTLFWYESEQKILVEDEYAVSFLKESTDAEDIILAFHPTVVWYARYYLGSSVYYGPYVVPPYFEKSFFTNNLTLFNELLSEEEITLVVLEKGLAERFYSKMPEHLSQDISSEIYVRMERYGNLVYNNRECYVYKNIKEDLRQE